MGFIKLSKWYRTPEIYIKVFIFNSLSLASLDEYSPLALKVPEQLASHTAIVHPGHPAIMIIYGGTGAPFGLTTSNTVVSCDLDTQTFSQLELDETDFGHGWPMPLYGQAVTSDTGRMFTVGGTSGFTYFMDVHMLDFRVTPPRWSCLYRSYYYDNKPIFIIIIIITDCLG